jgi:carboxymethylenebutenolidase
MCLDDACDETRRRFLIGASAALAAASTGLEGLSAARAQDEQPPPLPTPEQIVTRVLDDAGITHGPVTFQHGGKETIDGYLARPKRPGSFPPVIVIAGNTITEEYIPNTCAALAVDGFVGLAPNIFHGVPGSAPLEERKKSLAQHVEADALQDIQVGMDYLRTQEFVQAGGMGVVGFCYGGKLAMMLGARSRAIDAVVAYHPGPTTAADVARLVAPTLIHIGTTDRHVSVDAVREIERILKQQGAPVTVHVYEGADHGFLAYTRPYYEPDAAKLSWQRTIQFLRERLQRTT